MSAEFKVKSQYFIGGLGLVVTGEIKSGEIQDGKMGTNNRGKKCAVVKIEVNGEKVSSAKRHDIATIVLRYLNRNDVHVGESIFFG